VKRRSFRDRQQGSFQSAHRGEGWIPIRIFHVTQRVGVDTRLLGEDAFPEPCAPEGQADLGKDGVDAGRGTLHDDVTYHIVM